MVGGDNSDLYGKKDFAIITIIDKRPEFKYFGNGPLNVAGFPPIWERPLDLGGKPAVAGGSPIKNANEDRELVSGRLRWSSRAWLRP